MKFRKKIHSYFNAQPDTSFFKFKWWFYFYILDHGLLRTFYQNYHSVDQNVYRSAQPSHALLKRFAESGGKTVLSLRGCTTAPYWYMEQESCSRLGLKLANIPLSATSPPDINRLKELIDFLGRCEKPLLIHCKSGADRSALGAFVYSVVFKAQRLRVAKKAFSFFYLHNRFGRAGILDRFVSYYEKESKSYGLAFEEWLYTRYDEMKLKRDFN